MRRSNYSDATCYSGVSTGTKCALLKGGIVRSTWNESYIRGGQSHVGQEAPNIRLFASFDASTPDWVLTLVTEGKSPIRLISH